MNQGQHYSTGSAGATRKIPLQLVMGERAAVEIVATFDVHRRDYARAVEVALGRKGSRDALICTLSRERRWGRALDIMPAFMSRDAEVKANLEAVIAIAAWHAGREDMALGLTGLNPQEHLHQHIASCINRGTTAESFVERMARLDLEKCYAFHK